MIQIQKKYLIIGGILLIVLFFVVLFLIVFHASKGASFSKNSFDSSFHVVKSEYDFQKVHHPDVFLSSFCPHTEATFSIVSQTANPEASEAFDFTVTLKESDKQVAKEHFINWVKSLGLNDQEAKALILSYQ